MSIPPAASRILRLIVVTFLVAASSAPASPGQPGVASGMFPAENLNESATSRSGRSFCRLRDGSMWTLDVERSGERAVLVIQRYDAEQRPVREPVRQDAGSRVDSRSLACNGRGDFVVTWIESDRIAVFMRIYSSRGKALSPVMYAAADPNDEYRARLTDLLAVAISSRRIVVLETAEWLAGDATIATVMSADGTRLGTHVLFAPDNSSSFGTVRVDRHGNALIARGGKFRVLEDVDSGGRILGEPFTIPGVPDTDASVRAIGEWTAGAFVVQHDGLHEDRVGTLVSLDGRELPLPLVTDPARDGAFSRNSLATGPRPGTVLPSPYRWSWALYPWLPAPRLAKGNASWVMVRVEPGSWWPQPQESRLFPVAQSSTDGGRTWGVPQGLVEPSDLYAADSWWPVGAPDVVGDERGHFVAASLSYGFLEVPGDDSSDSSWFARIIVSLANSGDDAHSWSSKALVALHQPVEDWRGFGRDGPIRVETDGRGTWLVVWGWSWRPIGNDTGTQLFVARSVDDGASWSEPVLLAEGQGYGAHGLDVTWNGTDRWIVAWNDQTIRISESGDGVHWSEPSTLVQASPLRDVYAFESLFPLRSDDISIAADGSGRVLLVAATDGVERNRFGIDGDVFAWTRNSSDSPWSPPRAVASWATGDGTRDVAPKAAGDGRSGWIVVWRAAPGGSQGLDGDIFLSRSRNGRSWTEVTTVAVASGDSKAMDHPGDLVMAGGKTLLSWVSLGETTSMGVGIAGDSCGDATLDPGEDCDDGNVSDGDGCNRNCSEPACGNGAVDPGEECDDGNQRSDDFCTTGCTTSRCGDGYREPASEDCDDGNDDSGDGCVRDCVAARCGDGFVRAGAEECDPGAMSSNDCPACRFARCGDGYLLPGTEECDDGNADADDSCTEICKVASCGDGRLHVRESCDPGVGALADYCTRNCSTAECPDADGNGVVTVNDAMVVLGGAVGACTECPLATCDANSNRKIDVSDARLVLRRAVGIVTDELCLLSDQPVPPTAVVSFSLDDPRALTDIRLHFSHPGPSERFDPFYSGRPACASALPDAIVEFSADEHEIDANMLVFGGVSGGTELFRCSWYGGPDLSVSDFRVTVDEAADEEGGALLPVPEVIVSVE